MREINREIVSAVIISSDGKICLGKKHPKKGGVYSDCWHLPGGGVDPGESLIQALTREVLEETGMNIDGLPTQLVDDAGSGESEKTLKSGEKVICQMHFNVFRVETDKPSSEILLKPSSDFVQIGWVDKKNLKHIKQTPPSERLFIKMKLV